MFRRRTKQSVELPIVKINIGVDTAFSYFIRIAEDVYHRVLFVFHHRMLDGRYVFPVFVRTRNAHPQRRRYFKDVLQG